MLFHVKAFMVTCFEPKFAGPIVLVEKFTLIGGAQAVIWAARPRNDPRSAGSDEQ